MLGVTRGELEMYVRRLEARGYPADTVTQPKVAWEGQKRTVLQPLEFAALLSAARGPRSGRFRKWADYRPNSIWIYDTAHFTRAGVAATVIEDLVSRK